MEILNALEKIQRFRRNVKKFDDPVFVSNLINEAIQKHESELIMLNTQNQIFKKGIRADGTKNKRKGSSYPVYSGGY